MANNGRWFLASSVDNFPHLQASNFLEGRCRLEDVEQCHISVAGHCRLEDVVKCRGSAACIEWQRTVVALLLAVHNTSQTCLRREACMWILSLSWMVHVTCAPATC